MSSLPIPNSIARYTYSLYSGTNPYDINVSQTTILASFSDSTSARIILKISWFTNCATMAPFSQAMLVRPHSIFPLLGYSYSIKVTQNLSKSPNSIIFCTKWLLSDWSKFASIEFTFTRFGLLWTAILIRSGRQGPELSWSSLVLSLVSDKASRASMVWTRDSGDWVESMGLRTRRRPSNAWGQRGSGLKILLIKLNS